MASDFFTILVFASCGPQPSEVAQIPTSTTETTTTTIVGDYRPIECPSFSIAQNVGEISSGELDEVSGLVAGRTNPDLLWAHNDSGDLPRVFAISRTGELKMTVDLSSASALDYEDIAISSSNGRNRLWVADTGDNYQLRGAVRIYSFDEPPVGNEGAAQVTATTRELVVRFRKPGTSDQFDSINSEAFFIDRQGNGYLVAKVNDAKSAWVFRITAEDLTKDRAVAEPLVQITTNRTGRGVGATGADLSADGKTLVIKNYNETFLWHFVGDSPSAALIAAPIAPCVVKAGPGEAIAVLDNGSLVTIEEGSNCPVVVTRRR